MANDFDLEELEQRLYSQIHHSADDNEPYMPDNLIQETVKLNKKRYFQPKNPTLHNNYANTVLESNRNYFGGSSTCNTYSYRSTNNTTESLQPVQQIVISPVHNIVLYNNPHYIAQEQKRATKRAKRRKKRRLAKEFPQPPKLPRKQITYEKQQRQYENFIRSINMQNYDNNQAVSPEVMKVVNSNEPYPYKSSIKKTTINKKEGNEVISISESEEDDCVEIPQIHPLVFISDSEDEDSSNLNKSLLNKSLLNHALNSSLQDEDSSNLNKSLLNKSLLNYALNSSLQDVMILESKTINEIISLDEGQLIVTENISNNLSTSETAPISIIATEQSDNPTTYKPGERQELLSTPESAVCNDFLDNTDLPQKLDKFNFNLHGLYSPGTISEFVKPPNPVDIYETESSCSASTTDISIIQNNVFKEVDFPDNMFSENNIENFGTLITPKRKQISDNIAVENIGQPTQDKEVISILKNNYTSEDSSSESEYDEPKLDRIQAKNKSKLLPTLSPFDVSNKKSNKFDNIESDTIKKIEEKYNITPIKNFKSKLKSSTPIKEADDCASLKKQKKKKNKTAIEETPFGDIFDDKLSNSKEQVQTQVSSDCKDSNIANNSNDGQPHNCAGSEKKKRKKIKSTTNSPRSISPSNSKEQIETHVSSESKGNNADNNSNDDQLDNCEGSDKKKRKKMKSTANSLCSISRSNSKEQIEIHISSDSKDSNDDQLNNYEGSDKKKRKKIKSATNCPGRTSPKLPVENNAITVTEFSADKDMEQLEICIFDEKKLETLNPHNSSNSAVSNTISKSAVGIELNFQTNKEADSKIVDENLKDFIIVDEDLESVVHSIADSSDSENNFQCFKDVGHDLKLANCLEPQDNLSNNISKSIKCTKFSEMWTDDKNKFYSQIINVDNFEIHNLVNNMSDDPSLWKILEKDKHLLNVSGSKRKKCNRCRESGHVAIKCPNLKCPLKCKLCGATGHLEPRCPNKLCFQCGNHGNYSTVFCKRCVKFKNYVCRICKLQGHAEENCPDLWRRYHLTTTKGQLVKEISPIVNTPKQHWCSSCARVGHMEYTCERFNRIYPPSLPHVVQYDDVYDIRGKNNILKMCSDRSRSQTNNIEQYSDSRNKNVFQGHDPGAQSLNTTISLSNPGPSNIITVYPPVNQFNIIPNQQNTSVVNFYNNHLPDFININTIQSKRNYPRSLRCNNMPEKRLFHNAKLRDLCAFIEREISSLQPMDKKAKEQLRQKMMYFDRVIKSNSSIIDKYNECYREVNMLLLGVHHFARGRKHFYRLVNFVNHEKQINRKTLWDSYYYIFGKEKHHFINYMEYFNSTL